MRKASPRVSNSACRLLRTRAPGEDAAAPTPAEVLRRRCETLRPRLTELVGREGFRALLARALVLATGEFPWLGSVQVDAAGSLTGLDEGFAGQEPAAGEAGGAAVLAHLLGLLVFSIGAEFTRQLVSSAWPDTPLADTELELEEDEA